MEKNIGYHFTKKKSLKSIMKRGLIPMAQKKKDDTPAVFYSEKMSGAITMYADFIRHEKEERYDGALEGWSNEDKVFLEVNLENVKEDTSYKQRNFSNRCTRDSIPPEKLKVVGIKNKENGEIEF